MKDDSKADPFREIVALQRALERKAKRIKPARLIDLLRAQDRALTEGLRRRASRGAADQ